MKIRLIILLLLISVSLQSQTKYQFLTGANKKGLDTLAAQKALDASKDSEGIMEQEADPDKYMVGPNDQFTISIPLAETVQFRTKISPDGKLFIDEVGVVNLKGQTLSNAYKLIEDKIKQKFNIREAHIGLTKIRKFKMIVSGHIHKPVSVTATAMDRVSEVIEKAGGMKLDAGIRYIKLLRKGKVINVDLAKFFLIGDKEANPYVLGGDQVIVNPIDKNNLIEISGDVATEDGEFEFVEGDSLSTLIKLGQGFLKSAFLDSVEIARYDLETKTIKRWFLDLTSWKDVLYTSANLENDFSLQSGDRVYIRKSKDWIEYNYVVIEGEVKYPGKYAIDEGQDRLSDLIDRAGGFTTIAEKFQIEFIRQKEKFIRDPELERLSKINSADMTESENRYFQVRIREKKGSMPLNYQSILDDINSIDNIPLISKDSVVVPRITHYVNVQGRVKKPGLIKYNPDYTYMDYINIAGGFGSRADEDETFITKSSGEQFIAEDMNYVLAPGDVILVPPIKEVSILAQWQDFIMPISQTLAVVGILFTMLK